MFSPAHATRLSLMYLRVEPESGRRANGGAAEQREEMRGGWDLEQFHGVGGRSREQPALSSRPRGGPTKEEVGVPSSYPARERGKETNYCTSSTKS
jgi:hypothetical protein